MWPLDLPYIQPRQGSPELAAELRRRQRQRQHWSAGPPDHAPATLVPTTSTRLCSVACRGLSALAATQLSRLDLRVGRFQGARHVDRCKGVGARPCDTERAHMDPRRGPQIQCVDSYCTLTTSRLGRDGGTSAMPFVVESLYGESLPLRCRSHCLASLRIGQGHDSASRP